jgi:glycosyltransferase involved in cell wall biosynthesis
MDVLLISRCPPFPVFHGDRLIPYHLARELSARRYQIDLLAFYQQPGDIADVPRYGHYFRSVKLIREPRRTRSDYLQRSRHPEKRFPRSAEECWSPEMWRSIEETLQQRTYDVAHLFGGVLVSEYRHLAQQMPNVIVPYESFSLWMERAVQEERGVFARWTKRFQQRMAQNYESWMFEGYDRVIVLTDHDAAALRKLNPELPLVVIPNGVDVEYYSPTGYEPDEPALLFLGNYDYPPNLDAALRLVRDIFPRIKQKVPAARLMLIGGNVPPELAAYASDSVEIPGRVPDLRPYFESALIFISPLRLGAGIKNKILESMAMETPVVATSLSCEGIPVIHGEHVLLGETDDELISSVFRLCEEAELRQRLRQNGRQLVEQQFTWQRVAEQYDDLYDQIIRERRSRV